MATTERMGVDPLAVMCPATKQCLLERAADYDKGGEFARGKAAGIRSAVEEIERETPKAVGVLEVMDDAARTLAKVAQMQMTERAEEIRQARAAVAELVCPQTRDDLAEIRAALEKAHEVCGGVVKLRQKVGPIQSHANSAAWQLSNALKRLDRMDAALAPFSEAQS